MKAKLLNMRSDCDDVPIINLKDAWLTEHGFTAYSRIALCTDTFDSPTLINTEIDAHKRLEKEFQDQVHIISNK